MKASHLVVPSLAGHGTVTCVDTREQSVGPGQRPGSLIGSVGHKACASHPVSGGVACVLQVGSLVNTDFKGYCGDPREQSINKLSIAAQLFYIRIRGQTWSSCHIRSVPHLGLKHLNVFKQGCILQEPHFSILSFTRSASPAFAPSSVAETVTWSFNGSSTQGAGQAST